MKRLTSALCTALALTFAVGSAVPVAAAPFAAPSAPAASSNVIEVQNQRQRERRFERRQERRENRFENRQDRREARFENRNGNYYYNGRRGYRERRAGYRQYNGYWFPAAAFIAGAVIGGAISQPVVRPGGSAHVQWCYDRWRSYRALDNSYQPTSGPRRICVSPYR